jgi:hypothetical protein
MTNSKALDALRLVIAYLYRLVREDIEDAGALLTAFSGGEDIQRCLGLGKVTKGQFEDTMEIESFIASLKEVQDLLLGLLPGTKHYYLH